MADFRCPSCAGYGCPTCKGTGFASESTVTTLAERKAYTPAVASLQKKNDIERTVMGVVKAVVAVAVLVAVGYAVYLYADARAFATMLADAQQRVDACIRFKSEEGPGRTYACQAMAYSDYPFGPDGSVRGNFTDKRMQKIANDYAEIGLKYCHQALAVLQEEELQQKRDLRLDSHGHFHGSLESWEWKQWREILNKIAGTKDSCWFLEHWYDLHPKSNLASG